MTEYKSYPWLARPVLGNMFIQTMDDDTDSAAVHDEKIKAILRWPNLYLWQHVHTSGWRQRFGCQPNSNGHRTENLRPEDLSGELSSALRLPSVAPGDDTWHVFNPTRGGGLSSLLDSWDTVYQRWCYVDHTLRNFHTEHQHHGIVCRSFAWTSVLTFNGKRVFINLFGQNQIGFLEKI